MAAARDHGCDAIHPGYGFLSENAAFARRCSESGITFVGPRPETLELLGDKVRARALAEDHAVPIVAGLSRPRGRGDGRAVLRLASRRFGHGRQGRRGRGRAGHAVVRQASEVAVAVERARSEAAAAFGNPDVYVERLVQRARHIEVQIAGDDSGAVMSFGDRDCSIQRRHQKLIEIAPAPALADEVRTALADAALRPVRRRRLPQPRHLRVPGRAGRPAPCPAGPLSKPTPGCRSSTPSPRR